MMKLDTEAFLKDRLDKLNTIQPAVEQNTFHFSELWERRDEVQKFLIPELIPDSSVAILIGEDGIGKTQILTQLCLSIAFKFKTFLGQPLNAVHNRALIVATEDSRQKFTKAMVKQALSLKPNLNPDDIEIYFTEGSNFDTLDDLIGEISSFLNKNPYDLIVIDALSDLFTMIEGEINSNSHARKILGKLQHICNKFETTIIIIHHAAKSKLVKLRETGSIFIEKDTTLGAGAITSKPRTVLALSNDPATVAMDGMSYVNYLHVVKANLMGKQFVSNAIKLVFDGLHLTHREDGLANIDEWKNAMMIPRLPGNSYPGSNENGRTPNARPNEVPSEKYEAFDDHAFEDYTVTYKREEFIDKISAFFGVGKAAVASGDGYLNYMVDTIGTVRKPERGIYASNLKPPF